MKHDGKCEKMTMFWNARAIRIAQPCHIVAATERLKGYIQNWTSWVTGQGGAMIRSNATRGEDADQGQDRTPVKLTNENYSSRTIIA